MKPQLNAEQEKAAACLDRPVLVTAGAGSGKTRMLTERFVNAVLPGAIEGWEPAAIDEVVAITFAEKAAGEIAERVRLELRSAAGPEVSRQIGEAWISTIHGLCSRLLRRHAFDARVDPRFSVADTLGASSLRERAFEETAGEFIERDPRVQALFATYAFGDIFAATKGITGELAVAGMQVSQIALEPSRTVGELREDVELLLSRGTLTCDLDYSGKSAAPAQHAQSCRELLDRCGLIAATLTDAGVLEELLRLLVGYKPLRSLKGLEDISSQLAVERERLLGEIVSALVAPLGEALKQVVCGYAGRYSELKRASGLLDFDDLQVMTVKLLEDHPALAARYREHFRVVMIDEFQDTDALQLRLVEALSDGDLCTVGDENQSIYRFRGADVEVYRRHRASMREQGALVAELGVNYRSHPDILGFVNGVFSSELYFGPKLLRLSAPEGDVSEMGEAAFDSAPRIEMLMVDSTDSGGPIARECEARLIAERLAELQSAGVPAGSMAILLRRYRYAHVFASALGAAGLRAVIVGGSRFFALPEIAVMRALTRVVANALDGAALGLLLSSDFVPVSPDAIVSMRLSSGTHDKGPLWPALVEHSEQLADADGEAVRRLVQVIERARGRAGRESLANVLLKAVEESGWDLRLLAGGNVGRDAFSNVLKFARQAAAFEASAGSGAAAFVTHLETRERLGDNETPASLADDGSDAVRIMSIHASKGLEFPVVVVPELAATGRSETSYVRTNRADNRLEVALKFPALPDVQKASNDSTWSAAFAEKAARASAEEDDRVLYVAFTRAQQMLIASGSMGLRPKSGTQAKNDLVRLARMFGVGIPIADESDSEVLFAGDVRCRLRVARPGAEEAPDTSKPPLNPDASPPAFGEALALPQTGDRLPDRLSYTQLSEFEHCPRRFWSRRVLGVRSVRFQAPGQTDPLRFGTALHGALRLLGHGAEMLPDLQLLAIAHFFELDREETERLRVAVKRYAESDVASALTQAATIGWETPFVLPIGGRFKLTGSIDLYARSGESATIVDYKSGGAGEGADLETRYRLQSDCYALAALRDGRTAVHVEFVRPEVSDDAGCMQRVSFDYVAEDAVRIEGELAWRYGEMEASSFEPTPSGEECALCDVPQGLCSQGERRSG